MQPDMTAGVRRDRGLGGGPRRKEDEHMACTGASEEDEAVGANAWLGSSAP